MLETYGLANQKLCYIQIKKNLEKKTKNVLENAWWILGLIDETVWFSHSEVVLHANASK